jgi:hypothetical protein
MMIKEHKGANMTAKICIRSEVSVQTCHFSCCNNSLTAMQTSVARNPAKHSIPPCFLKVGQLNYNFNDDGMVLVNSNSDLARHSGSLCK